MADVLRHGATTWTNYHKTFVSQAQDRIEILEPAGANAREIIRAAGERAQALLREARRRPSPVPVRPVGGTWSLSALNMADQGWVIETTRLNRGFQITPPRIRPGCPIPAEALLLMQGGALIDEVSDCAQELRRSLRTNGASNGQTIAGAIATGTHGSVLDCGAIQDQVRALHIVTPSHNLWVEPAAGVLNDDYIAEFGATPLRGDDLFQAALVHLGACGFVNAVLVETVPIYLVEVVQTKRRVGPEDIALLAAGNYRAFSARIHADEIPYFVQVILNPYHPYRDNALIRFLYKRPYRPDYNRAPPERAAAGHDVMSVVGPILGLLGPNDGNLLQLLMNAQYPEVPGAGAPAVMGTWGEMTLPHVPMANLFSASLAVPRERTAEAIDAIVPAFTAGQGETLMTLRFVKRSSGLLAFTQYDENCVIDFDGARTSRSFRAYGNVVAALDAAGIPFRRHWGKLHELTAARVAGDYAATLGRWRAARQQLLPDQGDRDLFRNGELIRLGL